MLFENVRVFDGERVVPQTNVLVEDELIAAVGEGLESPAGAEVIDGRGKTLLPGLIDAHVHVFTREALEQAPIFGVTTLLDMFTDVSFAQAMREEQGEGGATDRADLFSAGTLATAPGGHGTQFGLAIPTLTDPDEADAWVEARAAEGSDWIKGGARGRFGLWAGLSDSERGDLRGRRDRGARAGPAGGHARFYVGRRQGSHPRRDGRFGAQRG